MTHGSGVSRGDRNRNARLARLRELVPLTNAIVAVDLADRKQMVVVTDHNSKVLARETFRCRAWDLGTALNWAAGRAAAKGWAGVTVACEQTGHRWRVLGQLAADRGMPFVCVQPMVTSWARRAEDLTFDKTDGKDAVLIARLAAQLRCYVPEPVEQTWGRLRHLGARRERLIVEAGSQVRQIRDLLECVWPAALDTANWPFRSKTWPAALWVILDRDCGEFTRTRRLGPTRFEQQVRREITRRGGQKPCLTDRPQAVRCLGRRDRGDGPPPRGKPYAALRTIEYLVAHRGQPRPSSLQPDYTLSGTARFTAMQGQTTDPTPTRPLTQTALR
jgi:transposase